MAFSVSSARANITPSLSQNPYMAGFAAQGEARTVSTATPYAQPLYARCVILWEDSYPHAIISLDVLGIPRSLNQAVRQRLLPLASWTNSDISLNATHTHNGPALVDALHPFASYGLSDIAQVQTYTKWLEDKIVATAQSALNAGRTSVTLDYGVGSASIAYNRVGLSTVETAVPVLTLRAPSTWPRAVIWGIGCHPISAGWQEQWDGDFAAGACASLESAYPSSDAVFLTGPAGDQDPAGTWGWSLRNSNASLLASRVRTVVDRGGRVLSGPLLTRYVDVNLPLDTSVSPSSARSSYVARLGNPDGQPAWYQRHAELMVSQIDSGYSESVVPNPLQVWKFAGGTPLRMALVGGEVVSAYGQWARANYGGTNGIFICGYANEVTSYIPDLQFLPGGAFSDGSYEGAWEPDYPSLAGGSATVYSRMYHYSRQAPTTLLDALRAQLA